MNMKMNKSQPVRCNHVRRLLSAYVEGELTDDERLIVEMHLKDCAGCREEEAEYRDSLMLLRNAVSTPAPENLISEFHSKLGERRIKSRYRGFGWQLGVVGVGAVALLAIAFVQLQLRVVPASQNANPVQAMNPSVNANRNKIAMVPEKSVGAFKSGAGEPHFPLIPGARHMAMPINTHNKAGNHTVIKVANTSNAGGYYGFSKTPVKAPASLRRIRPEHVPADVIAMNLTQVERTKLAQKIAMLDRNQTSAADVLPPVKSAAPNHPLMTMMSESVQAPISRATSAGPKPLNAQPSFGAARGMAGGFGGGGGIPEEKMFKATSIPTPSVKVSPQNILHVKGVIREDHRITILKGERAVNPNGELIWIRVVMETMLTPH